MASRYSGPRGDNRKLHVYQIDFTAVASGKRIASTKRRVRWYVRVFIPSLSLSLCMTYTWRNSSPSYTSAAEQSVILSNCVFVGRAVVFIIKQMFANDTFGNVFDYTNLLIESMVYCD
jgi:hypothetical protein